MEKRIIVYGTLKKGFNNHRLLLNSKFIDTAITKNKYTMTRAGIPYVNEDKPTSFIHGEVYDVDKETLWRLDGLEGFRGSRKNSFYYRKPILVTLKSGEETEAEIYFSDQSSKIIVEDGIYK